MSEELECSSIKTLQQHIWKATSNRILTLFLQQAWKWLRKHKLEMIQSFSWYEWTIALDKVKEEQLFQKVVVQLEQPFTKTIGHIFKVNYFSRLGKFIFMYFSTRKRTIDECSHLIRKYFLNLFCLWLYNYKALWFMFEFP